MSSLPPAVPPTLPTLRILLAEDGLTSQRLAVGLLSKWGHQVTIASNGREVLHRLQEQPFDVVLMDVDMPVIDGLEATREIRRSEAGTGLRQRIVAMTADTLDDDRQKCLAAGMDDFVSKPLRHAELMQVLQRLFEAGETATARPVASPSLDIDWESILLGLDRDRNLLNSVLAGALEECPELSRRLERAVAQKDGTAISRAAHTIKGSLRILNLDEPTKLLEVFEQAGRSGEIAKVEASMPSWLAMSKDILTKIEEFMASGTGGEN